MTKEGICHHHCIHSTQTQIEREYSQACSRLCLRDTRGEIAFLFNCQKYLKYFGTNKVKCTKQQKSKGAGKYIVQYICVYIYLQTKLPCKLLKGC